jgi:hypothetical protein
MPDRTLPSKEPKGFVRSTGIPNTSSSTSYFAATADAVARCDRDAKCIGVSAQRMFYGTVGTPAMVAGRAGETESFVRQGIHQ